MASGREYLQSIFSLLVAAQNASDETLDGNDAREILAQIDDLASDLSELLAEGTTGVWNDVSPTEGG